MESRPAYVGIDLGTTNSAVAIFDGRELSVVRNSQGSTLTPSVVRIDGRGNVTVGARARFKPEIAFVDLGLPGFDGLELARRIRATGARVYLIALTGYGQREDKQRTAEAGFDDHLVKPALETDVERAIRRANAALEK